MQVHAIAEAPGGRRTGTTVWMSLVLAVVIFAVGITVVFPKAVLEMLLPDQTIYAAGFSEEKLGRVKAGMTEQEVLGILGRPLRVSEYVGPRVYESNWAEGPSAVVGAEFWWWSYSSHGWLSESYSVRSIKFGRDGKVAEVLRRYYSD
jgi:hypothetical protein